MIHIGAIVKILLARLYRPVVELQYILDSEEKRMRLERPSGIVELHDNYERSSSLMNSITQDMKYRQSLLTYAQKYNFKSRRLCPL